MTERVRCVWAGSDAAMVAYHDDEWGVPLHDERRLFEMLCLEGAQAGLSWSTILNRRDGYRAAYEGFDAERIAEYSDERQAALLTDVRIIRNRAKVRAFRENARAVLRLREAGNGLDGYLWAWVDGTPIVNDFAGLTDIPAKTTLSERISKDLKARGFGFVGPTIVYAYMQSTGMIDDHTLDCFRRTAAKPSR
jgi:DNA-3-methyladenine glycosylase I